jgi:protein TonB
MKRLLAATLFFVMLFSGSLKAQEREEISKTENKGKFNKTKEVYSVLEADKSIKDGPYQLFWNGNLVASGNYKNDKKDSLWQGYQQRSGVVLSRKWFTEGKKTGLWEFFDKKGEAIWSYDFDGGKATFQKPSGKPDSAFYQTDAGQWVRGPVDHPLLPLASSAEWLQFLAKNFRYPDEAVSKEQQGEVIVSITVDEHGEATDYTIFQSAAPSLDDEALRVIKLFPLEFIPAEKDGRKIKTQYHQPMVFRMDPVK